MINTHNKIFEKLQNCGDTHSGLGDPIMLVNTILDHMKLAFSVNEVIMIATMGAFSSTGMLNL